jgi:chromosome segregation protein
VTGGAAVRESGVLTRERELRELPREVRRLERVSDEASATAEAAAREPRRLATERQAVDAERAGQVAARKERLVQRTRLAGWLADLRAEQTAAEHRLAALAADLVRAERDAAALVAEQTALAQTIGTLRAEQATVLADLDRQRDEAATGERELAVAQRRLATLDERLRAERRRQADLLSQERALTDELALRTERAAALDGERGALAALHERLTRDADALVTARQTAATDQAPLRLALREAAAAADRLARATDAARTRLLDSERALGTSTLNVERARGDLQTLHQRITDDLDLAEPDDLLAGNSDSAAVAERESDAAGTQHSDAEREIGRLKERLRRVGYVGEDAVAEFEREAARQEFLREQLADVQGAAASLRALLADLQTTMRTRFDATFAKVADAFAEAFTTLFGGGSARLVLTGGENGAGTGIDIVAQPPGKRLQSLALLSGGERALTAAALLFAILRVNPTPFCLLDEVDAALDEANVVRFREQLRVLAADTQVIVVTHNRGTIETADTLYGVTMGNDGVSQVLSLRVAEMVPG